MLINNPSPARTGHPAIKWHWLLVVSAILFTPIAKPSLAQRADKLSAVQKLFVDSLGQSRRSTEMREHLVHRLERNNLRIVTDPAQADASLRGTGQIWSAGEVSLSPHSHSAKEFLLEGYLSVEVVGKDGQTLWSYLATPSRFPLGGLDDDLARQVASRLAEDIKKDARKSGAAASPGTAGTEATLEGAGATFPAPLYKKWFQAFHEIHPEVRVSYDAVGSGEGIRRVSDGEVDFGASEMPLSDQAMSDAHRRFVQIPTVLGAVVPIYNIPGLRHRIRFTPEILAGIYLGKIKRWNDPKIKDANRQADLPNADIVVVHRSDGSGTSYVWTDYLSKVSAEWKAQVGPGVTVNWPVGAGAAYNEGVAAAVQQTPNSIGYVELIYAIQHELSFAAVKNAAGEFIQADLASVTEAARNSGPPGHGLQMSITDAPGKLAYPIATYTWLLLPETSANGTAAPSRDKNRKAALLELVRWMLSSGQKSCSALGYAPLPPEVANSAFERAQKALQE